MTKLKEFRSCGGLEFRAEINEQGEKIIEGHAAVFNRQTQIADYFYEIIDTGAFDAADLNDVPLIVNHNFSQIPLARSRRDNGNSSMTLTIDETGLLIRAKLDVENNADARALYSAIERGDLDGMSFAFEANGEQWLNLSDKMPTRRITSIARVFEVSACTYPQYEDTDVHARSADLADGKKILENARAQAGNSDAELELFKLRNRILSLA